MTELGILVLFAVGVLALLRQTRSARRERMWQGRLAEARRDVIRREEQRGAHL